MGHTIRTARAEDSTGVRVVVARILGEYSMKFEACGADADLNDVEASYIRPGGCFFVVEDDHGRIAGSAGLMLKGDGVAELRKMYLLKPMRGQGIGKQLLQRVLDHARSIGLARVVLETATPMIEAQALYMAHGFRRVERHVETCRCDRVYELDLTPETTADERGHC